LVASTRFSLRPDSPERGRQHYSASKLLEKENIMKRNIARAGLVIILAVAWMVSVAGTARAEEGGGQKRADASYGGPCSLYGAAGNWGFTDNGTVIGVGPRIATGVFTLDDKGNLLNGIATSSLNGSIADETFSGTYTVSSNCTGTLTGNIYISGVLAYTVTVNLAFDQNGDHMRGLFTSAVESDGTALSTVIALDADKQ
jgi:hypothetical protein